MIAEPFICTQGRASGTIEWWEKGDLKPWDGEIWQLYADFEREKLKQLGFPTINIIIPWGYHLYVKNFHDSEGKSSTVREYMSHSLIGYGDYDYRIDSDSRRVLKRAEFMKVVCEKEQIEWVPDKKGNKSPDELDEFKAILDYVDAIKKIIDLDITTLDSRLSLLMKIMNQKIENLDKKIMK